MADTDRVRVSDPVTRVDFRVTDANYPFVGATAIEDCRMELEEIVPRGSSGYAEFFEVEGADSDVVLDLAADHGSVEAQLLERNGDSALFEFVVSDDCPAVYLGEQGALPREVYSEDGEGHVVAEIPYGEDADAVVESFLDAHPDAELVDREATTVVHPLFARRNARDLVDEHLTDRQVDILDAADEHGYYDWPRATSIGDLADELGAKAAAVRRELRRIEQCLIVLDPESPALSGGTERSRST